MKARGPKPPVAAPALVLVIVTALAATACGGGRVGVVDSERILDESVRALSYQRQLDEREKTMATDLQLLRGQLPPADLEARRTQYLKELEQMKVDLENKLNEEIRRLVAEIAREKRLRTGVIVKNPLVHAQPGRTVDITDEVIARLR